MKSLGCWTLVGAARSLAVITDGDTNNNDVETNNQLMDGVNFMVGVIYDARAA